MTAESNTVFMHQSAPMQGYTDRAWRDAHRQIFGGVDVYFTPFLRVESGVVRSRDLREVLGEESVVPQVIFRDVEELRLLLQALNGRRRVDLNLGCPFPPQMKRGRGAGMLARPEVLKESLTMAKTEFPEISLSVKMRLGADNPQQWREIVEVLGLFDIEQIAVHPRIGTQGYKGNLDMEEFAEFLQEAPAKVVFNGDIKSREDIERLRQAFPTLSGVMCGRGLLARPDLFMAEELSDENLLNKVGEMHRRIFEEYSTRLSGDSQLLTKIRSFWEYLEPLIGHRASKKICKANTLEKYLRAVEEAVGR